MHVAAAPPKSIDLTVDHRSARTARATITGDSAVDTQSLQRIGNDIHASRSKLIRQAIPRALGRPATVAEAAISLKLEKLRDNGVPGGALWLYTFAGKPIAAQSFPESAIVRSGNAWETVVVWHEWTLVH